MGERLDFPKQYNNLIRHARHHMKEGQWDQVEGFAKQAHDIQATAESRYIYGRSLKELGHLTEALDWLTPYIEADLTDEASVDLYFDLLLDLKKFDRAKTFLHALKKDKAAVDLGSWRQKTDRLNRAEQALIQQLYQLSSYPAFEQFHLLKDSRHLPADQRLAVYKQVVANPYVNEIAKSYCLLDLKDQEAGQDLAIVWFNQQARVKTDQLEELDQITSVQQAQALLKESYADQPAAYHMIKQEFDLHMMALYPFNDEVITDPGWWISLYGRSLDADQPQAQTDTASKKAMVDWYERLTRPDGGLH